VAVEEHAGMLEPTVLVHQACHTGECPLWHAGERRIYWVDIPAGRLFRYAPATGQMETFACGAPVGGFTIQADGTLLLFMAGGAVHTWRDGHQESIIEGLSYERGNRFNDVIADPQGRVYCGTMTSSSHAGRLYRLDPGGGIRVLKEGVRTSNGMGFSPDLLRFFHTDSGRRDVYVYDYDRRSGAIANGRLFLHTPERSGAGKPDGITVDAQGFVWTARWGGSCITRHDPDGREVLRVPMPVRNVTCLTFGGVDYRDVFVTTAGGDDPVANGQWAGSLFHFRSPVPGKPEYVSRIAVT
jgi:sugar lactone lactonase YvrE